MRVVAEKIATHSIVMSTKRHDQQFDLLEVSRYDRIAHQYLGLLP